MGSSVININLKKSNKKNRCSKLPAALKFQMPKNLHQQLRVLNNSSLKSFFKTLTCSFPLGLIVIISPYLKLKSKRGAANRQHKFQNFLKNIFRLSTDADLH